jgi:hypothetical protein
MSAGVGSADFEKKRTAISAVISFNDAQKIGYSKMKLFEYFGVSRAAGYNWISTRSLTRFQGVRVKKNPKGEGETAVVKRLPSEGPTDQAASPPPIRKNPVRNGGRDRERLRHLILEDLQDTDAAPDASAPVTPQSTPSLSEGSSGLPSQQLLTPPNKRKAVTAADDDDTSQKPRSRWTQAAAQTAPVAERSDGGQGRSWRRERVRRRRRGGRGRCCVALR